ncbi:MAG: hypothetical protein CMK92_02575 [Pseudomonas sp.]|nr:hypothetical protein [Pseudomonas sp.]
MNDVVVIIGGGPVGLWTAIQIKVRHRNWDVIVYERYEEYKRKHVLLLDKKSFSGYASHPLVDTFVSSLPDTIRTSVLQEHLMDIVRRIGVRVVTGRTVTVSDVYREHPRVRTVIGADGSHSRVRSEYFGMEYRKELQYIVDVKYEVYGSTRALSSLSEAYPTLKLIRHVITEHVGKSRGGRTPVSARLLVSEQEYQSMRDATFKNPWTFTQLHGRVNESVTVWMNAKAMITSERRVRGSEKITALCLNVYAAKSFHRHDHERDIDVFLVGDAAFGVPYFRSLNNGIISGTRLARHMSSGYNRFMRRLSNREREAAEAKRFGLRLGNAVKSMNAMLPWQIIRWKDSDSNLLWTPLT